MRFKSLLFNLFVVIFSASIFTAGGILFYRSVSDGMLGEFESKYNAILKIIVYQARLGYDGVGSAYFKSTLEQFIKGDSNVESIVFLVQPEDKPKREALKLSGTHHMGEKRIFSAPIKNGKNILGICQITVSLKNYMRRLNDLMKRIIFFLAAIYFSLMAFFTWIYHFYFVKKKELVIARIQNTDPEYDEEDLKDFIFWEDVISALNIFEKKKKLMIYEKEMLNPITGVCGYYLTDAELEDRLKADDNTPSDYIFSSFLGFEQLCENYGFKKGYEFLEKIVSEIARRLVTIDNKIFIGHITDSILIIKCPADKRKSVCENILTIFKNGEAEISKKHLFLKKGWTKSVLMVYPDKEVKNQELEELEKIFTKSLLRLGKRLKNNSAYLYTSGSMKRLDLE